MLLARSKLTSIWYATTKLGSTGTDPKELDWLWDLADRHIPLLVVSSIQCSNSSILMSHDVQQVRAFEHPGEGRRRAKSTPKGRQVDPTAAPEIETLLGDRPRRRDLLIEHLHLIQDTYGQISAAHLAALADEMRLAFAEVFETATFYAHFDVVKEGEPDIPPLTVRVCDCSPARCWARRSCWPNCRAQPGPACAWCARPASAAATRRRPPRSGTDFSITRPRRTCLARSRAGDTHPHDSRLCRTTMPMWPTAVTALERAARRARLATEDVLEALDDAQLARARRRRFSDRAQMALGAAASRAAR